MTNLTKLILPLFALAFLLAGCSAFEMPEETPTSETVTDSKYGYDGKILNGKHIVKIKTTMGDITVELDADAAPKTVTNFVTLAKAKYFDNLTFHRVIPNFMLQGGDPNGNGSGGESVFGAKFADEINANSYGLDKQTLGELADGQPLTGPLAGKEDMTVKEYYTEFEGYMYNDGLQSLPMQRGMIAMANAGANTNGSQFFITQADTPWLAGKHTVFGRVTAGMDVVDKIANVPRDANDKPLTKVTYTIEVQE